MRGADALVVRVVKVVFLSRYALDSIVFIVLFVFFWFFIVFLAE